MGVRRARLADARAIAEINVRTWKESYKGLIDDSILEKRQVDEKRILHAQQKIQDPSSIVLVYEDEKVLGYVIAGPARDERYIKNELYAIYVQPDVQQKGIGTKLLNEYKRIMNGGNFYLYTLKNNFKARFFYERNGGVLREEFNHNMTIQNFVIEEVCYVFEL